MYEILSKTFNKMKITSVIGITKPDPFFAPPFLSRTLFNIKVIPNETKISTISAARNTKPIINIGAKPTSSSICLLYYHKV